MTLARWLILLGSIVMFVGALLHIVGGSLGVFPVVAKAGMAPLVEGAIKCVWLVVSAHGVLLAPALVWISSPTRNPLPASLPGAHSPGRCSVDVSLRGLLRRLLHSRDRRAVADDRGLANAPQLQRLIANKKTAHLCDALSLRKTRSNTTWSGQPPEWSKPVAGR